MPQIPFHYIDLRTFSYETEDEKRVNSALQTILPEDFPLTRAESSGHHGDRIIVFSTRVESADAIRHVLIQLARLPSFETLQSELDERVTENTELFLRLDKQAAFRGMIRRGEGITLRAKVEAYPAKKSAAVKNADEALTQAASLLAANDSE